MAVMGHRFDPSVLREYDIRGIVGKTLSPADALAIGRTMGTITAAVVNALFIHVGRANRPAEPEAITVEAEASK